jgi:hypothetical protein
MRQLSPGKAVDMWRISIQQAILDAKYELNQPQRSVLTSSSMSNIPWTEQSSQQSNSICYQPAGYQQWNTQSLQTSATSQIINSDMYLRQRENTGVSGQINWTTMPLNAE